MALEQQNESSASGEPTVLVGWLIDKVLFFFIQFCGIRVIILIAILFFSFHWVFCVKILFNCKLLGTHPWPIRRIVGSAVRSDFHFTLIYLVLSTPLGKLLYDRIMVDLCELILSIINALIYCAIGSICIEIMSDRFLSNLKGIVLDMAKSCMFPLPLLAVAHQQLIAGSSHSHGDDDIKLIKAWEEVYGVNISDAANAETYSPEELGKQITAGTTPGNRIGFIGLGAMGFGMATHLLKSNFCVLGYDVYKPTLSRFVNEGGLTGSSPAEVSKDVDVLVIMVTNEAQAENVLYGDLGAVSALPSGASIVLSSTVSPAFVNQLERRLQNEHKDLKLVDAPVSGGVKRASMGTLTIMASGMDEALKHAGPVLSALSEKLYVIRGGCGAGSGVKMVNQLLAGVHIASAAEAMAFGARLGLNTRKLFDVIASSGATSWMFENRVPHMVENDFTPLSALDIFVKDLGIVCRECSHRKVPLHIASAVHQLFLSGAVEGLAVFSGYQFPFYDFTCSDLYISSRQKVLTKSDHGSTLPPSDPKDPGIGIPRSILGQATWELVSLPDVPSRLFSASDVHIVIYTPFLSLSIQVHKFSTCRFGRGNHCSISLNILAALVPEIKPQDDAAVVKVWTLDVVVCVRFERTCRAQFYETLTADAAASVLGEMDAWIICPFFLQGGRYTIEDVHYVADSEWLVPAGDTEFAKDAAFGYKSSNLREWVEEKTRGRIQANCVTSISIQHLRKGGPNAVCEHLCSLQKGSTCIINAASDRDMAVFAAGMIQAELMGRRFLCRTAASFVSARLGITPKAPILPEDLGIVKGRSGGLIVVGSYVPKTTKQVEELKSQCSHILRIIEISVDKIAMKSVEERDEEINRTAEMADIFLGACKDTLIMTSRKVVTGKSPLESLEINFKVSSALVEIVRRITSRPRYILAKGGITSSDLATKALEAKCAKIVGQALAGVPLWQLGPESRHPGVPYIVFPGNVGDSKALAEVVKSWARPVRLSSTKELLLNAEKGGYAVGAFNVYNLEGIEAVVAAAEEEQSPAILQIHPSALKQGGIPLVACCIAAAEQACVPITVHFDHGNSKRELVEVLELGFDSVMVDGSHLPFKDNISYTKFISFLAHSKSMMVEAELGRLSGTEDDLTIADYEGKMTDVEQAEQFIDETGIDALAVCIGNVHGKYPPSGPNLRLDLLKEQGVASIKLHVFFFLMVKSGQMEPLITESNGLNSKQFNFIDDWGEASFDDLMDPRVTSLEKEIARTKEKVHIMIFEDMSLRKKAFSN
ncbi:hypothetical protein RHGRI_023758 [Rhododendron griersonianum]|uniref:Ketose-bisphosphate aldolase class-II family protein n=1 Tax=Rhododendron griersonianum TaxID=479676 RepID=A0AAV6J5W9_9ERIC|nr:hypothetical protein RHGRI_023758 [Rhododendron griersonianum]